MDDRRQLRATFDQVADRYRSARPSYPHSLFDVVVASTGLGPDHQVLEIGPGPGTATRALAATGAKVTALELGLAMAAQARAELADLDRVEVVQASFDDWEPPSWGSFDLVLAATSWHWTDPASRYQLAHRHLRSGGHLVFWGATHVVPIDGDPFFEELQPVYDEICESLTEPFSQPGQVPTQEAEIEASGLFEVVAVEQVDWEVSYDASGYIALLETFSGHIAMAGWQRERLYGEIRRRLAARPDGRLRRHWGAAVHIARRLG